MSGLVPVDATLTDLLESDLLTPNHDGTPEFYIVEADNVPQLVKRILAGRAAPDPRIEEAEQEIRRLALHHERIAPIEVEDLLDVAHMLRAVLDGDPT